MIKWHLGFPASSGKFYVRLMQSRWNSGQNSAVGGWFTTKVKEPDNEREACEESKGGVEIQSKRYILNQVKSTL